MKIKRFFGNAIRFTLLASVTLCWAEEGPLQRTSAITNVPPKITVGQLPVTVQNTIRGQAGSSPIDQIDSVQANGQTFYKVAFKRDRQPTLIWIDSTGNLLRSGQTASPSPKRVQLSAAKKVTIAEVPPSVREAFAFFGRGAEIKDINQGTLQGKTVYEGVFKHDDKAINLRVSQDGSLVRDDINDQFIAQFNRESGGGPAPALGRPAPWQTATASGSSKVELNDPRPVTFGELPFPVLSTIQAQAGAVALDKLEEGTWNGSTVYQATFRKDGNLVELRIGSDGKILNAQ